MSALIADTSWRPPPEPRVEPVIVLLYSSTRPRARKVAAFRDFLVDAMKREWEGRCLEPRVMVIERLPG